MYDNQYKELKHLLESLRSDLLDFSEHPIESQDLMEHFFKVKDKDPETYELLMLLYNEFHMLHKMNKRKYIELMDKALLIKVETINTMVSERSRYSSWYDKVWEATTFKNIFKGTALIMVFIVFIFILHKYDPTLFEDFANNTVKVIDATDRLGDD